MRFVFIQVSGGIIDQIRMFDEPDPAVEALAQVARKSDLEKTDAVLWTAEGMLANVKNFLDDNDQFVDARETVKKRAVAMQPSIYVIANPIHPLGFTVTSYDAPIGFDNPAEAVSELGQLRKDFGGHLQLYRVEPVVGPLVTMEKLDQFNSDCGAEDFDHDQVRDYLY
ncbi:hypothetical protein DSCW_05020 [Desulfosarcina widdelii]|uniref:Uncharacterized protein n=1 Tax=Desulfosarcina widdelii TaxID=947919 RepID=A0A5K7YXG0_9BACT|nr:hypothetical protein [Desulfosarcina widdelii]BBO73085.1 hypothetical protein DSCW_05020 [Desulfosarcina widdelii]